MVAVGAPTVVGLVMSVVVLVAGVGLGVSGLTRARHAPGASARAILDERLVRGSISVDEHRHRRALLAECSPPGRGGGGRRPWIFVAVVFTTAGLVGSIAFSAVGMHDGFGPTMGPWMMGWDGDRNGAAEAPVPGAREITVVGDEFSFQPDVVWTRAGETVNVRFENRGRQFHTLTITALGFELRAESGETVSGSLRVAAVGRHSIVCTVPGHTAAGMQAELAVTAAG